MPTRLENLSTSNFGDLKPKNNYVIVFNSDTKKFDLVDSDIAIGSATSISQKFIDIAIDDLDPKKFNVDGGTF